MAKRVGPFGHKQRRGRKKPGNPLLQSETLESRDLLTITLAFNEPYVQEGWPNNEYPVIGIVERFGDISQSLEVSLANSDPSEVSIPDSITIPANESSASFQVEILDDNELDGLQFAAITATAGPDSFEEVILIEDYETGQLQIDQGLATPGGTVSGNVSTSAIGPLSITIRSSRPDEVAPFSVEIPAGQSTANFVVPVSENGITQGPHEITLSFDSTSGLSGNFRRFAVADAGITTVLPIDDGFATDADRDGVDFEVLNTGYSGILIRSEDNFPYNAVRSMVEYDMSAVPANADITEAVWAFRDIQIPSIPRWTCLPTTAMA